MELFLRLDSSLTFHTSESFFFKLSHEKKYLGFITHDNLLLSLKSFYRVLDYEVHPFRTNAKDEFFESEHTWPFVIQVLKFTWLGNKIQEKYEHNYPCIDLQ